MTALHVCMHHVIGNEVKVFKVDPIFMLHYTWCDMFASAGCNNDLYAWNICNHHTCHQNCKSDDVNISIYY